MYEIKNEKLNLFWWQRMNSIEQNRMTIQTALVKFCWKLESKCSKSNSDWFNFFFFIIIFIYFTFTSIGSFVMAKQLFHRLNLMHNAKHAVPGFVSLYYYYIFFPCQSSLHNRYTPQTRYCTCEHFVYARLSTREIIYRAKKRTR